MQPSFELKLLRCPVSGGVLEWMSADELRHYQLAVSAALLINRAGELVTEDLVAALVCRESGWMYPVAEGIAVLVPGEAIAIGQIHPLNNKTTESPHG